MDSFAISWNEYVFLDHLLHLQRVHAEVSRPAPLSSNGRIDLLEPLCCYRRSFCSSDWFKMYRWSIVLRGPSNSFTSSTCIRICNGHRRTIRPIDRFAMQLFSAQRKIIKRRMFLFSQVPFCSSKPIVPIRPMKFFDIRRIWARLGFLFPTINSCPLSQFDSIRSSFVTLCRSDRFLSATIRFGFKSRWIGRVNFSISTSEIRVRWIVTAKLGAARDNVCTVFPSPHW